MIETLPTKAPGEVLDYLIDASSLLSDGETLVEVGSNIDVVGATKDSAPFSPTGVTVWLSGGSAATKITIAATLKTSGGRTFKKLYYPSLGPISIEDARAHLRSNASEDGLVAGFIAAAIGWIEGYTSTFFGPREVTEEVARTALSVALRHWPVASIGSIGYFDRTGAALVVPTAAYRIAAQRRPARVLIGSGWPGDAATVSVTYTAGFVGEVPAPLRQAVLVLAAEYYLNREAGSMSPAAERAVAALLRSYRRRTL